MDWTQFSIFLFTIGGLFVWNRSESRQDIRHMDTKIDLYRSETLVLINAIQQEMKDFHARLCMIEQQRNKK